MRLMEKHGGKIYLIIVLFSALIAVFNRSSKEKWIMKSEGDGFVLSLTGFSREIQPTSLEIRCGGNSSEVRLVMPVKVHRMGGGEDLPSLAFGEEYLDENKNPMPRADGDMHWSYTWAVSDDFSYASLKDSAATEFLERISGKPWVYLGSNAMSDNKLSGIRIRFAVDGFGEYKNQVAGACVALP